MKKKHELLKYAYDNYPKGTKFITLLEKTSHRSTGVFELNEEDFNSITDANTGQYVYEYGKWAEIVPDKVFVITSEDGVALYEGDEFIHVSNRFEDKWGLNDSITFHASKTHVVFEQPETDKAFSTRQAAESWIKEENKPKSIDISSLHGQFTVTKNTVSFMPFNASLSFMELSGIFFDKIVEARKSLQS